jgi:hypothetical protein
MTEEPETIENKFVLDLFKQDESKKSLTELMDDIKSVPMGMSEFQIDHFVLNGIEYPTDWAKFQQVKLQLHLGIQSLVDMSFQVQEAQARIELNGAEIEDLTLSSASAPNHTTTINNAKAKLKQISIEKNKFKIASIQYTAHEKLREILAFYAIFKSLKEFDRITSEQSAEMEEATWKLRAAYNPEFRNRYGLTPEGFIPLPHETFTKSLLKNDSVRGQAAERLSFIKTDGGILK